MDRPFGPGVWGLMKGIIEKAGRKPKYILNFFIIRNAGNKIRKE